MCAIEPEQIRRNQSARDAEQNSVFDFVGCGAMQNKITNKRDCVAHNPNALTYEERRANNALARDRASQHEQLQIFPNELSGGLFNFVGVGVVSHFKPLSLSYCSHLSTLRCTSLAVSQSLHKVYTILILYCAKVFLLLG